MGENSSTDEGNKTYLQIRLGNCRFEDHEW